MPLRCGWTSVPLMVKAIRCGIRLIPSGTTTLCWPLVVMQNVVNSFPMQTSMRWKRDWWMGCCLAKATSRSFLLMHSTATIKLRSGQLCKNPSGLMRAPETTSSKFVVAMPFWWTKPNTGEPPRQLRQLATMIATTHGVSAHRATVLSLSV